MATKATKGKALPAPPQSSSSSEEESEEEEERHVIKPNTSTKPPTLKPNTSTKPSPLKPSTSTKPSSLKPNTSTKPLQPYSESESETESDSDPEPNKPTRNPAESEEEEEEEEQQPVKKPESEPDTKKLKATLSSPFPSQSTGKFKRLWSSTDEVALIRAVSEFHSQNGRVPVPRDYASLFEVLKGKLSGGFTEKQLLNKVRNFRDNYSARLKKGADASSSSDPNVKVICEISEKLWGESAKLAKEKKRTHVVNVEASNDEPTVKDDENANGNHGNVNIEGNVNVAGNLREEFPYLNEAVVELGKIDGGFGMFYKNCFGLMDESKARDWEAKFKKMKYNEAKLASDKMETMTKLVKELAKLGK